MKKKLTLFVGILVVMFSCRKIMEDQETTVSSTFNVKAAKEHYQQLLSENTMTTSSDKKTLSMSERKRQEVIWSKAYSDKRNGIEYVEVPVSPSKKDVSLYNFPGDHVGMKPDKSIVSRSVQKMVIYRDATGKVNQRIVTYIPDKKYLVRRKNEVVLNSIRKLQSDFFGYIEYREWEGRVVVVLRIENGKVTKRYIPNEAKALKSGNDGGMSTFATICNTVCVEKYITTCVTVPEGEGYSEPYCTTDYAGTDCTTYCYDDGVPPPNPCPSGNCGGTPPGDSGSGGGGAPSLSEAFYNKIDTSSLDPCFKKRVKEIKSLDNDMGQIIRAFSDNWPGHNWVLESGTLGANINGQTGNYDSANQSVKTIFDSQKFANASDLAIARTLMHESAHAYLVSYFKNDPVNFNADYSAMVTAWHAAKAPTLNNIHHDAFVSNFVHRIATALTEYGSAKGYTFPTSVERDQFYSDLAWGGLTGTQAFQNLSSTAKNRILDVLSAEQYKVDVNGNPKNPKGGPGGC